MIWAQERALGCRHRFGPTATEVDGTTGKASRGEDKGWCLFMSWLPRSAPVEGGSCVPGARHLSENF